ncbi:beta-phosphoglucomutase [Hydrogenoanaerobacterium sp.]|uniref:beta-phosphoglucomutase n=1 Tax=Hydrogenoanaerobacterium sp. TaxID=2953763 RepID=UPI0028972C6E|nr:beta-phosphoglucomutase [Hydrogenoanaerobacterium sp.]
MNYRAVIFDLDGVICSTDEYHYLAWKQIADENDIPFDREINNRLRGVSRMESLEIILECSAQHFSQEQKEQLAGQKNGYYQKYLMQMTTADLTDEICQTLEHLRAAGALLAIGSSSKNAGLILQQIGLESFFDAVCDGNSIACSKPNPEVFLKAAAALGLPPRSCLVVEDAPSGVDAAMRGGFDCAGVGFAYDYAPVTYPLTSFAQLISIVNGDDLE